MVLMLKYSLIMTCLTLVSIIVTRCIISDDCEEGGKGSQSKEEEIETQDDSNVSSIWKLTGELSSLAERRAELESEEDVGSQVVKMRLLDKELLMHGERIISSKKRR